ncbi:MAG: Bax inhibitor-1/YccA family protein [Ilumatobacter sp.]|uniref:Bax inhibitor-1/YccA family protein n=1 Tax=Ilumatobacter sp. TaxID=1967498 RepID=UPI00329994B5
MSNPFFNEKKMNEDANGWAAPTSAAAVASKPQGFPAEPDGALHRPIHDGPTSRYQSQVMTVNGVITATAVLFTIFLVAASVGWFTSTTNAEGNFEPAPGILIGVILGFVAVMVAYRKPTWAKFLGPVYALSYGYAVGAISRMYEASQNGIVLQAAGATMAVFIVMLTLYRTGIIKVTEGFRRIVMGATLGVMVLYLVSIVISLFGGEIGFINSPSLLGIGFSVFVCALAASNLALDFDLIEKGTAMKMSKDYEWVAALGMVVTIVWLYLEILRLLSKLNRR